MADTITPVGKVAMPRVHTVTQAPVFPPSNAAPGLVAEAFQRVSGSRLKAQPLPSFVAILGSLRVQEAASRAANVVNLASLERGAIRKALPAATRETGGSSDGQHAAAVRLSTRQATEVMPRSTVLSGIVRIRNMRYTPPEQNTSRIDRAA